MDETDGTRRLHVSRLVANAWLGTSVGSGLGGDYPDTTHHINQLCEDAGLAVDSKYLKSHGGRCGLYPEIVPPPLRER